MAQRKENDFVRKLTVKGVMGANPDLEKLLKAEGKRMDLLTIFGVARKFKPDTAPNGSNFVRFFGQFRAVNLDTGEVFDSGQCIVPGTVQDALYGAMGSGEEVKEVQFAVRIGVKYDATAVTKYVYTVNNLMPTQENDPMTLLENSLKELKALPAPKK
jgi:hypothetical protein